MSKEVTIYNIARKLKLSSATVSRGLKNDPRTAHITTKRIHEAATKLGYLQNQSARNLNGKKTEMLGLIVPDRISNFMANVVDGIETVATQEGYGLLIAHAPEFTHKHGNGANPLFNGGVDGLFVVLTCDTEDLSHFSAILKQKMPVIFLDRFIEQENCTSFLIDNHNAGYEATTHLITQGCKRIVHVTAPCRQNIYADRLAGYRRALSYHNIIFKDEYLITGNLSMAAGAEAASTILKMNPLPDGAFFSDDNCAIACMLALKQKGLKIPGDIAFVGFNNDPASKIVEPDLTTISYSGTEVGKSAARYLINHLNGVFPIKNISAVMLRFELIVRRSSLRLASPPI